MDNWLGQQNFAPDPSIQLKAIPNEHVDATMNPDGY